MKKATAVLLQNMLARIKNLEKQVEDVIVNSTSEFQHLIKQIKSLNNSINNVNRTKGMENHKKRFYTRKVCKKKTDKIVVSV